MTAVLVKTFASLIFLCLILIAAYPVWAQESTSGATRKEKTRERIEVRKEKVAERMENKKEAMATREAALKAKLEKFKDKRKAEVADRVNTNLNRINQKQTAQMLKHLDKMSTILAKLEKRANQGTAAIASAKEGIATATASVKLQAEKDYTIALSSEGTVRKDAQKMREQLHSDLKALRVGVIDAKQAVANAIRVAKSGKLEIPGKEGTPSGR